MSKKVCRCCAEPIQGGLIACRTHWFALPEELRKAIKQSYQDWIKNTTSAIPYTNNVRLADAYWQENGFTNPDAHKGP